MLAPNIRWKNCFQEIECKRSLSPRKEVMDMCNGGVGRSGRELRRLESSLNYKVHSALETKRKDKREMFEKRK